MTVIKRLMRHWVPRFWVAALLTAPVWGVGLGELTVHTYLNEPLRAEVVLFDTESLKINDLRVELASEQEFQRVGAERVFWLTQLRFEVQAEGLGKRVLLTTDAPLREPYLDFVMAVRWPQGRLLRDYTALIDLPPTTIPGEDSVTQSQSDDVRPISNVTPQPDPLTPPSAETLPQLVPSPAESASAPPPTAGSFYVVVQNDTLWCIASSVAPDRLSVEQVMLEIIRMNPQAFQQQNVNGLKAGYRLELPLTDAIGVDRMTAIDAVALQNNAWQFRDEPEQGALTPVATGVIDAVVPNSGLPVADAAPPVMTPTSVVEPMSMADETSATLPDGEDTLWVDQALVAPTQLETTQLEPAVFDLAGESAAVGASRADFEALTMTVGRLQSTLAALQEQITQRDTELTSLKTLLALRDERLQAAVTALAKRNDASLRDRLVSAATSPAGIWVALFSLVLCLSWFYRRQQTMSLSVPAESGADSGGRPGAVVGADANAAVDDSGTSQDHMPIEPPSESAARNDERDRAVGPHSTEAGRPAGNHDSALATDQPTSPDTGLSSVERSRAAEGSEPLTRDDLSLAPEHLVDD